MQDRLRRLVVSGLLALPVAANAAPNVMANAAPNVMANAAPSGTTNAAPAEKAAATPTASPIAQAPATPSPRAPAPAPAPKPADPLHTPAPLVAHPEQAFIETVAVAGKRLIAAGLHGIMILSDDDGASWRQVPMPSSVAITGLAFADEHTGWAIGHYGAVLHTVDAGEHWSLVYDGARASAGMLAAAQAANAADNEKQKKIEAAQHLVQEDPGRPFLLIQLAKGGAIRLFGADNLSIESLDGGKSWSPWSDGIDNPAGVRVNGLAEREGTIVVAGDKGLLLAGRPEDGLHRVKPPFEGNLFGAIDGGRYGFIVFGQQGRASTSTNDGIDWHRIADPSPTSLTAGLLRRDGSVILADASGATWLVGGTQEAATLAPFPGAANGPILALAEASGGSIILAGPSGMTRILPTAPPKP